MSFITKNFKASDFSPVMIKGTPYNSVAERIRVLGSTDLNYSLESDYEVIKLDDSMMFIVKSTLTIKTENDKEVYNGIAQEIVSNNFKHVNYASALENAETSAHGRALSAAGIGLTQDFASADEINKNIQSTSRRLDVEDEKVFDELAEISDKMIANFHYHLLEMAGDDHEHRIKLLQEITLKTGNTKRPDWKCQDFTHFYSIYKKSITNESAKQTIEFICDQVNSAYLKFNAINRG